MRYVGPAILVVVIMWGLFADGTAETARLLPGVLLIAALGYVLTRHMRLKNYIDEDLRKDGDSRAPRPRR